MKREGNLGHGANLHPEAEFVAHLDIPTEEGWVVMSRVWDLRTCMKRASGDCGARSCQERDGEVWRPAWLVEQPVGQGPHHG